MIIRPRVWLQLRVKRMMVPWTAILAQAPCGKVKKVGRFRACRAELSTGSGASGSSIQGLLGHWCCGAWAA